MRRLWIVRVNGATRILGLTYGQFINGLRKSGIEIDRKMLADMVVNEPEHFAQLVATVKAQSQASLPAVGV